MCCCVSSERYVSRGWTPKSPPWFQLYQGGCHSELWWSGSLSWAGEKEQSSQQSPHKDPRGWHQLVRSNIWTHSLICGANYPLTSSHHSLTNLKHFLPVFHLVMETLQMEEAPSWKYWRMQKQLPTLLPYNLCLLKTPWKINSLYVCCNFIHIKFGSNMVPPCWKPKQSTYIKHDFDIHDPLV